MKEHKEIIKTVAITILITANIAFLAGVFYANKQNDQVKAEVKSQISSLKAELPNTAK